MSKPARTARPGTFFVTTVTYNRRRLFQIPANADLFLATLQHYRHEGHYKLHSFVVMPDHVHLLFTPQAITLERAMGLIKGGFSRRIASNLPVWQRGFTDHRIRDKAEYQTRLDYIHQNPVRSHLVEDTTRYPWSSASLRNTPSTAPQNPVLLKGTASAVPQTPRKQAGL